VTGGQVIEVANYDRWPGYRGGEFSLYMGQILIFLRPVVCNGQFLYHQCLDHEHAS
jgi:hypothetical protein